MTYKNVFGRKGAGSIGGYPSMNAYKKARREQRLADIAERVKMIENYEKRMDEHYRTWIAAYCYTDSPLAQQIGIECSTKWLLASYREFYGNQAESAAAWGRWMVRHYARVARNGGRVYLGIAVKSKPESLIGVEI